MAIIPLKRFMAKPPELFRNKSTIMPTPKATEANA